MMPRPPPIARRARFRFGIGARLYLALAGAVAFTTASAAVAWYSFVEIQGSQRHIVGDAIPAMSLSLRLARQSATIAAAAPSLVNVKSEHERIVARGLLDTETLQLTLLLQDLARARVADAQLVGNVRHYGSELVDALGELDRLVGRRLSLAAQLATLGTGIGHEQRAFEQKLAQPLDDQIFFMVTGYRSLDDAAPAPVEARGAPGVLQTYRSLNEIAIEGTRISGLLAEAVNVSEQAYLSPLRERYDASRDRVRDALARLGRSDLGIDLETTVGQLTGIAEGPDGVFATRTALLATDAGTQEQLRRARDIAARLADRVDDLVADQEANVARLTEASRRQVIESEQLLVGLTALSLLGALLIGWLYVGRGLVRRIVGMARAMRQMASGLLDVRVETHGDDEVSDMAKALEVFRRHALEVQRLNLVEKLNAEVTAKNADLERALEQLRAAQSRIVTQEKMASLGQLTAGIAHEIKNPLNFVNNFAILSKDLLDELREVLDKEAPEIDKDARADIDGIFDDLTLNLGKITEHGKRADSIVRSMLDHSRQKPGERSSADVNRMVEEFVNLAYHGLRGQDRTFNSAIRKELDPAAGEAFVFTQELSRAILNIVNNAFQATHEKKQKLGGGYEPTLWVATRDLGDEVEIRIKDNGPGIPPELREKIFEPFFTTKPAGHGTGLGLSMTYEIVVQAHGGRLEVNTEPGEWTEFVLTIPRQPAEVPA